MASKDTLMGLGLGGPFVADVLGVTPTFTSAAGATVGSATQIGETDFAPVVTTGTSGVKVPEVTSKNLGTPFSIMNLTAATIAIYAASNSLGSAVTFYSSAASGILVSAAIGKAAVMIPISVSSWVCVTGCSAG